MNQILPHVDASYYLWGCGLLLLFVAINTLFASPFKFVQHTLYLSGTLGAGKTSYAAYLAEYLQKRKGYEVYSTFALEGAIPFDLSRDPWPRGPKKLIILDEMLWLQMVKFFTEAQIAAGLTMARQHDQIVLILRQSHLTDMSSLDGPVQIFVTTKKLMVTPFGNINIMRFSSNKFRRTTTLKAEGSVMKLVFIPRRVYKLYVSKWIFGLTCDKEMRLFSEEEMKLNEIRRAARFKLERKLADQLAKEEANRMLQSGDYPELARAGWANAAHVTTDAPADGGAAHVEPPAPPARKPRVHRVKRAV